MVFQDSLETRCKYETLRYPNLLKKKKKDGYFSQSLTSRQRQSPTLSKDSQMELSGIFLRSLSLPSQVKLQVWYLGEMYRYLTSRATQDLNLIPLNDRLVSPLLPINDLLNRAGYALINRGEQYPVLMLFIPH